MGVMAGPYQRMLTALLPPGRLWRLIGDSFLGALFAACADEIERLHIRATELINESVPADAVELLEEYERELDIEAASTVAERQARIVARHVARQRFRPEDFRTALAQLLGQDPDDVVVLERTAAFAESIGDVREIFRFFIYRDPDEPNVYFVDSAQDLVDDIKPSHTVGHVIESIDFICDDEFSLCDRDLLGA
jgi:uncharacterized protein YmfQ (DUF2313 family)